MAITVGSLSFSGSHLSASNFKPDREKRVSQLVNELSQKGYDPYNKGVVDIDELVSYGFDALVEINNELKRIDKKKKQAVLAMPF